MRKFNIILIVFSVMLFMTACGEHEHKWMDNGCETYKTCKKCDEQGEYVDHQWKSNGCESYKVCEKCGKQGEYIEHDLDKFGVCKSCGKAVETMIELTNENIEDYISCSLSGSSFKDRNFVDFYEFDIFVESRSDSYIFEDTTLYFSFDGIDADGNSFSDVPLSIEADLDRNGKFRDNYVIGLKSLRICKPYVKSGRVYINTTPEEFANSQISNTIDTHSGSITGGSKQYSESGALMGVDYDDTAKRVVHSSAIYYMKDDIGADLLMQFGVKGTDLYNPKSCQIEFSSSSDDFELFDSVNGNLIDKIDKSVEVSPLWQNIFCTTNGLMESWECVYCKFNDYTEGLVGFRLVDKVNMPEMASNPDADPMELGKALVNEIRRFYDTWGVCGIYSPTYDYSDSEYDYCFDVLTDDEMYLMLSGGLGADTNYNVYSDMKCLNVVDNVEDDVVNAWNEYYPESNKENGFLNIMGLGREDRNIGLQLILYRTRSSNNWKTGYLASPSEWY